jgi:hypothetical protein
VDDDSKHSKRILISVKSGHVTSGDLRDLSGHAGGPGAAGCDPGEPAQTTAANQQQAWLAQQEILGEQMHQTMLLEQIQADQFLDGGCGMGGHHDC